MAAEALRLFVAIELPEHVRRALAEAVAALRHDLRGPYRWVTPESLHLTLKFLGKVDAQRVPLLTQALEQAGERHGPFPMRLEGAGVFPERGAPRVVWAGVGGDAAALGALREAVEAALVDAGEAAENRAFRPHLTLARIKDRVPREDADHLRRRLEAVRFSTDDAFTVQAVSLMQSTLRPQGAEYTRLAEAGLR